MLVNPSMYRWLRSARKPTAVKTAVIPVSELAMMPKKRRIGANILSSIVAIFYFIPFEPIRFESALSPSFANDLLECALDHAFAVWAFRQLIILVTLFDDALRF